MMQRPIWKRQAAPSWQMANLLIGTLAIAFWWLSWQGKPTLLDWPLRAIAAALAATAIGGIFA